MASAPFLFSIFHLFILFSPSFHSPDLAGCLNPQPSFSRYSIIRPVFSFLHRFLFIRLRQLALFLLHFFLFWVPQPPTEQEDVDLFLLMETEQHFASSWQSPPTGCIPPHFLPRHFPSDGKNRLATSQSISCQILSHFCLLLWCHKSFQQPPSTSRWCRLDHFSYDTNCVRLASSGRPEKFGET